MGMARFGLLKLGMAAALLAGCGSDAAEVAGEPGGSREDTGRAYAAGATSPDSTISATPGAPAALPAGVEAGETARAADGAGEVSPAGRAQDAPAAAPTTSSPDAAAILSRAERAYESVRSLEADFVQVVTVPLLDTTQRSRGKIFHRRPDRFLMRFSEPQGDVVVADGRYLWMYYPSTDPKQVLRTRAGDGGQQVDLHKEFLANAANRYSAVIAGSESVGGQPTDVLVLTPRTPSSYRRVRIWVDRDDSLVRKFEIVEENESVRLLELRNLKTNGTLADALFRFTPPPGAQVFEQ